MKKIIALFMVTLLMIFTLVGCGDKDRLNYVKGLKDYVELCDLEKITVDIKSDEYLNIYENAKKSDLAKYTYPVKEGTVENSDVANIDYAGKVDGVAFTGGTAKAFDLTIGSGQFIEGFEEQLIGVKIGDTVDIKVTFPEGYNDSTDLETGKNTIKLSGTDAVFTVTVNSVKRPYAEINDDFAAAAGFDSKDAYLKDLEENCIKNYICDYILKNSKVTKLPPDKDGNSYEFHKKSYTDEAQYYGYSFEDYISARFGIDEATFKKEVLAQEIIIYACFDNLGLKVTDEAVEKMVDEVAKENNITVEKIKETYSDNYLEYIYVNNTTVDTLYEKITVVR